MIPGQEKRERGERREERGERREERGERREKREEREEEREERRADRGKKGKAEDGTPVTVDNIICGLTHAKKETNRTAHYIPP